MLLILLLSNTPSFSYSCCSSSPDAPVISTTQDFVLAMAGTEVTLDCAVKGNPRPTVSWNSRTADSWSEGRSQGNKLILKGVRLSDAGQYSCEARNSEGHQSVSIKLQVHGETCC